MNRGWGLGGAGAGIAGALAVSFGAVSPAAAVHFHQLPSEAWASFSNTLWIAGTPMTVTIYPVVRKGERVDGWTARYVGVLHDQSVVRSQTDSKSCPALVQVVREIAEYKPLAPEIPEVFRAFPELEGEDFNLTIRIGGNIGEVSYSDYVPTNGTLDENLEYNPQLPLARFVTRSFRASSDCWKDDPSTDKGAEG